MPSKKHKRPPPPAKKPARGRGGSSRGGSRHAALALPEQASPSGFTMQDEARNTRAHQPAWGQDARLRQRPVAFVSAGFTEPLKNLPKELADFQEVETSELLPEEGQAPDKPEAAPQAAASVQNDSIQETVPPHSAAPAIAAGVESHNATEEPVAPVRPLETQNEGPLTRSGFFFDLLGYKSLASRRTNAPREADASNAPSTGEESDSSEDVVLFKGRTAMAKIRALEKARASHAGHAAAEGEPVIPIPAAPDAHNASSQTGTGALSRSNGDIMMSSCSRGRSEGTLGKQEEEDALIADYIANMAQDSEDDPQEHHSFSLTRDLGGDHNALDLGLNPSGSEQDFGSEEQEIDSTCDEADDEALARLLSKQEELGLGSEELILFSDAYTEVGKQKPFASAAAVAEAFDNLDLADHQASMAGASKRRNRQAPTFDLSDSELEAKLQAAWYNDRERKKNRKMEREELRTQGLLSKNIDPDDLRVKYGTGMTLDEIKSELKSFILGSNQTLQFPPMDKQARMMLHELAGKFKIKSQSTGKGDQRRPVLSRTKQTVAYATYQIDQATEHIESASARIRRKHFYRTDGKGRDGHGFKGTSGGRSGGNAVTYREGEIVGAAAPELGQENKGRAMLEKMGWSKGMALGAFENQGILEPVAQVIKRSKAGLG